MIIQSALVADLDIPQSTSGAVEKLNRDGVSSCDCVHPCDLTSDAAETTAGAAEGAPASTAAPSAAAGPVGSFDFFYDPAHCRQRQERCEAARRREALFLEPAEEPEADGAEPELAEQPEQAGWTPLRRRKRRRRHDRDEDEDSPEQFVVSSAAPRALGWLG